MKCEHCGLEQPRGYYHNITIHCIDALKLRVAELEAQLAEARSELDLYIHSAIRNMGGLTFPKYHFIDELAKTIAHHYERSERLTKAEAQLADMTKARDLEKEAVVRTEKYYQAQLAALKKPATDTGIEKLLGDYVTECAAKVQRDYDGSPSDSQDAQVGICRHALLSAIAEGRREAKREGLIEALGIVNKCCSDGAAATADVISEHIEALDKEAGSGKK